MNGAHAHLLVNHISVFASTFGLIAFVWAWMRGARQLHLFAIALFVVAGVGSLLAVQTGDAAEKIVEHLPNIVRDSIHTHEQAADYANINAIVLAVLSLISLVVDRYKPGLATVAKVLILLAGLMTVTSSMRTAYLGGLIRHTEIQDAPPQAQPKLSE